MDEAHKELVTYIRSVHEWCARTKSGGDWFAIDPDESPFKAADALEALAGEVAAKQGVINHLKGMQKHLELCVEAERETGLRIAAERDRLKAALGWALGEGDEWPERNPGEGAFYWRAELRRRAAGGGR